MLTQVREMEHYRQYQQDKTDRTIAGIILGQVLDASLTNPDYVLLVVDEVTGQWHRYLNQLGAVVDAVDGCNVELEALSQELATRPEGATALHQFVDKYVGEVEGGKDLPEAIRAKLWLAHAMWLAPSDHPIHTSAAARLGQDPGV